MGDITSDDSGTVFDRMRLSDDACFLCGRNFSGDATVEHIFPRWLQNRHNLWGKRLTLLNGTSIPYSQLTIPCCNSCNTNHLSNLENRVRDAVESGYAQASQLPSITLYQWMGKIFYGILRKELNLLFDRQDTEAGTIVPQDLLQGFSTLHLFLQSIRQPFEFPAGEHFSTVVVNLHSQKGHEDFYFRDSLHPMVCSLRTGNVGFIVALQDARIIAETYGRYVEDINGKKLTSVQFDELYARCLYQTTLITRVPKFISVANDDPTIPTSVHMLPIGGLSSLPVVNDWVQAEYFEVLKPILEQSQPHIDPRQLFVPPDKVMTWMTDETGQLMFFDENGQRV